MPRLAVSAVLALLLPAAAWAQTWPNEVGPGGDALRQTITTLDRFLASPATSQAMPGGARSAPVPILDWAPPPAMVPAPPPVRRASAAPARRVARRTTPAPAPTVATVETQWLERRMAEREQQLSELQRQVEADRRTLQTQRSAAATSPLPAAAPPVAASTPPPAAAPASLPPNP
ncbi:hypothetical protein LPC08_20275 [Roseomonas sp. OT10]|uniref:hypothetical protein n=1 Tax=Roseomonas cutis TaxID=2897332 RepID=UPI001E36739A|nr:hypothetical protein [Roseomonas sp. OT10]UFN48325.1 hypothetical protein LPC08_20275 [Roseomonas sp. OT10]